MNEILQKRIVEAAEKIVCSVQCAYFDLDKTCCCYEKKFCMKTAEEVLQNQWISVEEALPTLDEKYDFSERYLVKTNEGAIKVMRIFRNIAWCDIYNAGAFISFENKIVTHWMSIPNLEGGEK